MSDPGSCSDVVSLGGTVQEAGADGDPPHVEPRPPCTEDETPSAAKQPPHGERMEIDFHQPDTCTETLSGVSEGQDAGGIPDEGDLILSLHLFVRLSYYLV